MRPFVEVMVVSNVGDPVAGRDPVSDLDGSVRALRVLEVLAGMEQPAGLPAIASAANLSRTKAYRALRSLEEQRFIDHIGHSGYRLGARSVALAALIGLRPALLRAARPILNRLAVVAGETASLHLRSGDHRVLVLGAEPRGPARREGAVIGERAPLTSGCSGTAMLAHLPPVELADIASHLHRRRRRQSATHLARIRVDGYALSFSDNHSGINGIAAPLQDPSDGYPLGSIAIAGAEARLPESALRALARPLRASCKELAPQLARELGPSASQRLAALDVTIQGLLDT